MAVTLAALFVAVVAVQVGRSIANLVAGAGWTWPETSSTSTSKAFNSPLSGSFWTSLPGVLAGDSGAGLALRGSAEDELAGRALTWGASWLPKQPSSWHWAASRSTSCAAGARGASRAWLRPARQSSCSEWRGYARSPTSCAPTSMASTQAPRSRGRHRLEE